MMSMVYEGSVGDNADVDEQEDASQADDGSMHNVEVHCDSRIYLGTSNDAMQARVNGHDADADVQEDAYEADDG